MAHACVGCHQSQVYPTLLASDLLKEVTLIHILDICKTFTDFIYHITLDINNFIRYIILILNIRFPVWMHMVIDSILNIMNLNLRGGEWTSCSSSSSR